MAGLKCARCDGEISREGLAAKINVAGGIDCDFLVRFRVIASENRSRIVTNRAPDCRVHLRADPESIVRDIAVRKPSHDLRHAAGT